MDDLTEAQLKAVTTTSAPLCIMAAAGAGKTRVLTRRIAFRVDAGSADPAHILALTFTRKAAGELVQRVQALGLRDRVASGTFHSVATAQLRTWWAKRQQTPPTLLERKARLLTELAAGRKGLSGVPISELAGHIEWAKARLIAPDGLAVALERSNRASDCDPGQVASLFSRYEDEKKRRNLIDFDDLLIGCLQAMRSDPEFAATQRWRWRHFFVDEYQDLNPLQHQLLQSWVDGRPDICVVGDPHQAIYGWNGADPALLTEFTKHFPGAEVIRLDANHRCTPQVVAAAASVLGEAGSQLTSSRPDGPVPQITSYPSDIAEAHGTAAALRRAHASGLPWSQMAVLVRTNAQTVVIAQALRARGIPHVVAGSGALLQNPLTQALLADLSRRPEEPLEMILKDLQAGGLEELGSESSGPSAQTSSDADATKADIRATLYALGQEYLAVDEGPSREGFAHWLRAALGREHSGAPSDAVSVSSFHRAKGLEWTAVWLSGLEAGLVPIGYAKTALARAEERRLLYVGLTRAERDIHCSWAETRSFNGRQLRREPSPYLASIAVAARPGAALDPREARQKMANERARLRHRSDSAKTTPSGRSSSDAFEKRTADKDPLAVKTFDKLALWRSQLARSSGVPAYVVLHDATLRAIAAARPCDSKALAEVPGMGPVKISRYGASLLALVNECA